MGGLDAMKKVEVKVICDVDGDGETLSAFMTGTLIEITYLQEKKSTDFADAFVLTVTVERTGRALWTETFTTAADKVAPLVRQNVDKVGGLRVESDYAVLADDRLKFVIASGGQYRWGRFYVTYIEKLAATTQTA